MFAYLQILVLFFGVSSYVVSSKLFTEDINEQKLLWKTFKSKAKRRYSSVAEEQKGFKTFLENLKRIDELQLASNERGGSAKYGLTRFSDLSQDEFRQRFLNTKFPTKEELSSVKRYELGACPVENIAVNWTGVVTTPIKDQGYCGSCWSFAAAQQVESDIMRLFGSNVTYLLSEQQLLDCDNEEPQSGCDGGVVAYAFLYLMDNYIETEESYPYSSYYNTAPKTCAYNPNEGVAGLETFWAVLEDETCMAYIVQNVGTISVAVNADSWINYGGGVWSAADCGHGEINHAVQIVGVDIPGNYWIVRNTWGPSWGEEGYIRLEYGTNACNITRINGLFTDPFLYSAPPVPTNQPNAVPNSSGSSDSDGLSGGAIAGIVLGGIAGCALIVAAIAAWCYCQRKAPLAKQTENPVSEKGEIQM